NLLSLFLAHVEDQDRNAVLGREVSPKVAVDQYEIAIFVHTRQQSVGITDLSQHGLHRPSLLRRVTAPVFRVWNKVSRRYAAKLQDPVADLEYWFLLHGCPPCSSGSCLFSPSMFGF